MVDHDEPFLWPDTGYSPAGDCRALSRNAVTARLEQSSIPPLSRISRTVVRLVTVLVLDPIICLDTTRAEIAHIDFMFTYMQPGPEFVHFIMC